MSYFGDLKNCEDFRGYVCPYAIFEIITKIQQMEKGETKIFVVDDPLAIKSVPEEIEEIEDTDIEIEKEQNFWKIRVERS